MRIPANLATPLLAVPCLLAWPDAAGAQQSDTLNYFIAVDCDPNVGV